MKISKSFKHLCTEIQKIVNVWDPEGLLKMGAPLDEYESEIEMIVGSEYRIKETVDVEYVIKEIFSSQFNGISCVEKSGVPKQVACDIFKVFYDHKNSIYKKYGYPHEAI